MKNVVVLQHQDKMIYSKEFLQIKVPVEINILLYSVVLFFIVAICLVVFGKIDDVVKVSGIVRTNQNVSSVKNAISGKIAEKYYLPGKKIEKGEVLYKIDSSAYEPELKNLESEKILLRKKLIGTDELLQSFNVRKNLVSKENVASFSRFENFINNRQKLEFQLKIAEKALNDEKTLPETLKVPSNIEQKNLEYKYYKKELESYESEFFSNLNNEKQELEFSLEKSLQEIKKLQKEMEFLSVSAPVSGFVQEVSSLNIGDYIESGKTVLNIIPNDSKNFRVELQISPKDIGKIKEGLKVKYRLSAFPYFEYKGAEGKISSVDSDIRSYENGSFYYSAYADIDRTEFSSRTSGSFPIRAGLEANCRIVLEHETILFFILKKMNFLY